MSKKRHYRVLYGFWTQARLYHNEAVIIYYAKICAPGLRLNIGS